MPVEKLSKIMLALLLVAGFAGTTQAAVTFDDLLKQARQLRAEEVKLAKERVTAFQADLANEQRRLNEAVATRDRAEATSNALIKRRTDNIARKAEVELLLVQHQGNLGELFGVTRQIAGDAANVLQASQISVRFPASDGEEDRVAFLKRIAAAKALPSIRELERIWYELQQEMTESGKVMRVTTDVVQKDDSINKAEVLLIGPFTAIAGSDYLAYLSTKQQLSVLRSQPNQDLRDIAALLAGNNSGTGYQEAIVDPARGALLGMYVERPDWLERIEAGQEVGYIIISVGILGALLALFQYVYLFIVRIKVANQLRDRAHPDAGNPLGRMLLAVKGNHGKQDSPEVIELRISEAVLREVPRLERFQSFLKLAVAAGPLLGLIGTVVGMIITFQTITASGASDPRLMADGIGQAMIATVLGLGIAIPLLFVNAGLASLSRGLLQILDKNSTGILAERLEGSRQTA
ncbi:MAG: MotA/TolQ/ExbB proton channel family protein [Gammaproteobacteria bacterium]|nr:MAG: MotA/TolQ/ExbB proton channel family protein [Gammaproteobacteria bacterium]